MPSKPLRDNLCGLSSRKPQPPFRSQSLQSVFFFRNSNNVEYLSSRDKKNYDDFTTYAIRYYRHQGGLLSRPTRVYAHWGTIGIRRGRIH
jgi:hypothetical protein